LSKSFRSDVFMAAFPEFLVHYNTRCSQFQTFFSTKEIIILTASPVSFIIRRQSGSGGEVQNDPFICTRKIGRDISQPHRSWEKTRTGIAFFWAVQSFRPGCPPGRCSGRNSVAGEIATLTASVSSAAFRLPDRCASSSRPG
jgi:hypothetical protein